MFLELFQASDLILRKWRPEILDTDENVNTSGSIYDDVRIRIINKTPYPLNQATILLSYWNGEKFVCYADQLAQDDTGYYYDVLPFMLQSGQVDCSLIIMANNECQKISTNCILLYRRTKLQCSDTPASPILNLLQDNAFVNVTADNGYWNFYDLAGDIKASIPVSGGTAGVPLFCWYRAAEMTTMPLVGHQWNSVLYGTFNRTPMNGDNCTILVNVNTGAGSQIANCTARVSATNGLTCTLTVVGLTEVPANRFGLYCKGITTIAAAPTIGGTYIVNKADLTNQNPIVNETFQRIFYDSTDSTAWYLCNMQTMSVSVSTITAQCTGYTKLDRGSGSGTVVDQDGFVVSFDLNGVIVGRKSGQPDRIYAERNNLVTIINGGGSIA